MNFTLFGIMTFVIVCGTTAGIGWLDQRFPDAWRAINRGQWRMYCKAGRGLRRLVARRK